METTQSNGTVVVYLICLRIAESLLLSAQMAHFGHQLIRMNEETRTEQEREDVCPLKIEVKQIKLNVSLSE